MPGSPFSIARRYAGRALIRPRYLMIFGQRERGYG